MRFTLSFAPLNEITSAGQHQLWPWRLSLGARTGDLSCLRPPRHPGLRLHSRVPKPEPAPGPAVTCPVYPVSAPRSSPVLQLFQGTEGRSRPLGLTIDEAKAGAVQVIVLQVVIPGTTVSASQHLLPARHSSDKREVIAPTLPAENSLGLGDRHTCQPSGSPFPTCFLPSSRKGSSPCPPPHGFAGCC